MAMDDTTDTVIGLPLFPAPGLVDPWQTRLVFLPEYVQVQPSD